MNINNQYTLIFATNNQYKIDEIQPVVGKNFNIITLATAGIHIDIPELYDSLEKNALTKAETIFTLTHQNCFGEDTGLEVEALNGEPGVKSARYAGEERLFEENIKKLLSKLENITNRSARFRTVIALIWKEKSYLFEGICKGRILEKPIGNNGFGYDAVFVPENATCSFAEMTVQEKNMYSHRRKAVDKLINFLKKYISE